MKAEKVLLIAIVIVFACTPCFAQGGGRGKSLESQVTFLEAQIAQLQPQFASQTANLNAFEAALAEHAANRSAHHARYSDAEAQTAVGQVVTPTDLVPLRKLPDGMITPPEIKTGPSTFGSVVK